MKRILYLLILFSSVVSAQERPFDTTIGKMGAYFRGVNLKSSTARLLTHTSNGTITPLANGTNGQVLGISGGVLSWVANGSGGGYTFNTSSIVNTSSNLALSGDVASPGNSMLYGTNGSGVKGWYAQPSGGTSGIDNGTTLQSSANYYIDGFGKAKYHVSTGAITSHHASSFENDFAGGQSRLWSIGANTGTMGTYEIYGASTDASVFEKYLDLESGLATISGVLHIGSFSADQSGANGRMYYNSTTNKFRVYQNGAWTDMVSTGGGGGGIAAGSSTQIQFNTSGAFDASDKLRWSGTTPNLYVGDGTADNRIRVEGSSEYTLGLKNGSNPYVWMGATTAGGLQVNNASGTALATFNSNGSISVGGGTGTSGQVLTSNGSGSAPTWQTPSGGGGSYTDADARAAISLTTTGSGAATYNSTTGVLNIPTPSGGVSDADYGDVIVSGGSWTLDKTSPKKETLTITSSTSYTVTSTDQNVIIEGSLTNLTLPMTSNDDGRVLWIQNNSGATISIANTNLYFGSTGNTASIAPSSAVKLVYKHADSKWYRMMVQ